MTPLIILPDFLPTIEVLANLGSAQFTNRAWGPENEDRNRRPFFPATASSHRLDRLHVPPLFCLDAPALLVILSPADVALNL